MHYFEKQQVDQIGIVSVALQKVLIFLMVINAFSLFSLGGVFGFFLCLIGFIGASRRRTCLLMAYFSISVFILVAGFLVGMYAIVGIAYYPDYEGDYDYSSSSSTSSSYYIDYTPRTVKHAVRRFFASSSSSSASASASSLSVASASASASTDIFSADSSMSSSWEGFSDSSIYMVSFLVLILAFFLLYMKIFSVVLAYRLRKMIRSATSVLPTEYREEARDNSCAEEQVPAEAEGVEMQMPPAMQMPNPYFTQPGYMPYTPMPMPNMQFPGSPNMVPPPMMYGQYPVYYSFAPIPQQAPAAEKDEKL